jgi:hypothetical protein
MEIHQSPLDHIHQDMFEYKSKQDDEVNGERLVDKFRVEHKQTTNNSDELISQEETERKLREKLELELASKEHQITTLVVETQKLQSTLIKVKETSSTQVRKREKKLKKLIIFIFFFYQQISDLENTLSGREKLIAQLESKLQSQADYDQIKQELT